MLPLRRDRSNSLPGYTLVEILVVIVVVAIAAAIIVPNAINTQDFQVVSAARMITADLQYAQSEAITSQAPITVAFYPGNESYGLSNASGALIHPMTKSAYLIDFRFERGFDDVDIVSVSFGENQSVAFDELGAPDNAGTITLQAGPHLYRIDVAAATGKVTVVNVGP